MIQSLIAWSIASLFRMRIVSASKKFSGQHVLHRAAPAPTDARPFEHYFEHLGNNGHKHERRSVA